MLSGWIFFLKCRAAKSIETTSKDCCKNSREFSRIKETLSVRPCPFPCCVSGCYVCGHAPPGLSRRPGFPGTARPLIFIYNLSRLANSGEASVVSSRLMHSLRLSFSGTSTGLGRFGAATPGLLAAARGGRSVSAAPVQDMEPPHDDMHKTTEYLLLS